MSVVPAAVPYPRQEEGSTPTRRGAVITAVDEHSPVPLAPPPGAPSWRVVEETSGAQPLCTGGT